MFTPEFLAAYDAGRPTWLLEKLAANEVFAWAPKAPTRFYYGTKDTDVSPAEAPAAATEMARRGGNATAVCTGEFNHIETAMHAIPAVRRWFDEVSGSDSR